MGLSENVVYPIVPNGFHDHYPVFKWLAIIGNINPTFSGPNPHVYHFPPAIPRGVLPKCSSKLKRIVLYNLAWRFGPDKNGVKGGLNHSNEYNF